MRVLGIDPGLAMMGYGVIEENDDSLLALDYGVLTTSPGPVEQRLWSLQQGLASVIARHGPSEVAVELIIPRSLRTALALGQAQGVVLLAAGAAGLPVFQYNPLHIKQVVTQYGRAPKEQVQEMVRLQLGLKEIPQPDDAADALAVALCHLRGARLRQILSQEGLP